MGEDDNEAAGRPLVSRDEWQRLIRDYVIARDGQAAATRSGQEHSPQERKANQLRVAARAAYWLALELDKANLSHPALREAVPEIVAAHSIFGQAFNAAFSPIGNLVLDGGFSLDPDRPGPALQSLLGAIGSQSFNSATADAATLRKVFVNLDFQADVLEAELRIGILKTARKSSEVLPGDGGRLRSVAVDILLDFRRARPGLGWKRIARELVDVWKVEEGPADKLAERFRAAERYRRDKTEEAEE